VPNLLDQWHFMNTVMCDPTLTDLDRRLSFRMLDYYQAADGCGWSYHWRLADELSVERESVSRSLRRLKTKGLFSISSPYGRRGRKYFKPNWGYVTEGSHGEEVHVTDGSGSCDPSTDKTDVNVTEGSQHTSSIKPFIESASPPKPPKENQINEAVEEWNALADRHGLARVQKLTGQRDKKLKARLKDCGGLQGWLAAMEKIENSPGLLGDNDSGWQVDFDFILREGKFTKILEGGYDHWRTKGKQASFAESALAVADKMDAKSVSPQCAEECEIGDTTESVDIEAEFEVFFNKRLAGLNEDKGSARGKYFKYREQGIPAKALLDGVMRFKFDEPPEVQDDTGGTT
jgi:hypothetical protein